MIILHLLSNWKWTERAEPAALLARAQQALGATVFFGCDRGPDGLTDTVSERARALGLTVIGMHLPKHARLRETMAGIGDLRTQLAVIQPTIVHCHMLNAHFIARIARYGNPKSPCLVRSCYDPEGRELGLRVRLGRRAAADGLIVIHDQARQRMERIGIASDRIAVIEPGIDLERFRPTPEARAAARRRWDLSPDHFVVGMVTRIRRTRRTGLAVDILAALRESLPQVRVLLVGRGSIEEIRRTVTEPADRLGVADRLIMAGYQQGEDLVQAYHAMDALLYPRPGTDQSCRTVREAMAAGLPIIAGPEGFLPHLVRNGVTGVLPDLSIDNTIKPIRQWVEDRTIRSRMAQAALTEARTRFDLKLQARLSLDFYQRISQRGT